MTLNEHSLDHGAGVRRSTREPTPNRARIGSEDQRWRLPVLMYHSIPRTRRMPEDPHAVALCEFEHQLGSLSGEGWLLVGLTEALTLLKQGNAQRVIALTFDDGLADLINAYEVLQRHGARATAYIPTGSVGCRGTAVGAERLGWSELSELSRGGVEIGSHSVSHHPLDVLASAEMERELVDSKKELADQLGVPVPSFCYPHGYSSARVQRAVRDAGYTNACIVGRRIARPTDNIMAVPRLHVRPGVTADAFDLLLRQGEPGTWPQVKRLAAPGWRLTRLAARKFLHRKLT
jgi:peptidoglycan/xylan/chitin deacetylase (PgdA/CDA1 family)